VGRYTGSVIRAQDVPDTMRCSRKENKQAFVIDSFILCCSSRDRNNGNYQQERTGLLERLITQSADGHRESAFLFQPPLTSIWQHL